MIPKKKKSVECKKNIHVFLLRYEYAPIINNCKLKQIILDNVYDHSGNSGVAENFCRLLCLYGSLLLHGSFRFMWPIFTYKGSFTVTQSPFTFVRPSTIGVQRWSLQQTSKKQSKTGRKNYCNRETLQRNKIVTNHIPTGTLYTHYLAYNMQNIRNGIVVFHININITIVLLYGIL